ncbi:NUDIX hydrolase [Aureibaculum sp. A20]|uniref:NUDIX hydrolase n=1 Tax=Aureibaculum flavum TaxID=2795986 RepID=A0ABS0WNH0_9FLAO|nr:NUDIX domain-containing protein [Aureibaculum flavum]MBJ2173515.1 NUDIX hydrolase [Aureibaculum flavum]
MLNNYSKEDKVLLAVDCIIFGFDGQDLKILLIKRDFEPEKGKWSLIGGFLKKEENLDESAIRILNHLTGLHDIYMEQFYAFSKVDRDPAERTISVAYYALIDIATSEKELIQLNSAKWFSLEKAPKLIFDHNQMVKHAVRRLKYRTKTNPIGFELLPDKFTMLQLQNLYESVLNKKLDKRNFTNKINALDILIKLEEKDMESSKKGSFLYQFDLEKYNEKLKEGFVFKI